MRALATSLLCLHRCHEEILPVSLMITTALLVPTTKDVHGDKKTLLCNCGPKSDHHDAFQWIRQFMYKWLFTDGNAAVLFCLSSLHCDPERLSNTAMLPCNTHFLLPSLGSSQRSTKQDICTMPCHKKLDV